jgi:hypothetical protein
VRQCDSTGIYYSHKPDLPLADVFVLFFLLSGAEPSSLLKEKPNREPGKAI